MDSARKEEILARMGQAEGRAPKPALEREIAIRAGAPLVLFGTVSKVADDFRLDLKLERVADTPETAVRTWDFSNGASSKSGLLDAVRKGGNWVRQQVGENESEIHATDRRPEEVTTENWEALRLYSEGQRLAGSDRLDEAILAFKEATDKDPKFAMAWMRIGDSLDTIGRSGEGLEYWRKALEVAGTRRLTRRASNQRNVC
jgi:tetratricopeptide (TPR) repeat protein